MKRALAITLLSSVAAVPLIGLGAPKAEGTLVGTLRSVWLRRHPMIVYLENVEGNFPPPTNTPTIDQKNKMFVPHLLAVLRGTTIRYMNHDDTKHNVYFIQPDGKKVNLGTGVGEWSKEYRMDQAGVYVHRCNIHEEMSAYVVVLDNPYYALIDKRRSREPAPFRLEGIPPGNYRLHVWCERFYNKEGHKFNRTWDVSIKPGEATRIELEP
ncbi:MAG: hypothetical protein ACE5G6_00120 [Terriglobia bacterium]